MQGSRTLMLEAEGVAGGIEYSQMIITCEACGNVKRFVVRDQAESQRLFNEFHCENNCGRNLYSFITLGTLRRERP